MSKIELNQLDTGEVMTGEAMREALGGFNPQPEPPRSAYQKYLAKLKFGKPAGLMKSMLMHR